MRRSVKPFRAAKHASFLETITATIWSVFSVVFTAGTLCAKQGTSRDKQRRNSSPQRKL
jgi:hypothetical protein